MLNKKMSVSDLVIELRQEYKKELKEDKKILRKKGKDKRKVKK
jgi:hypothetical protein